MNFNVNERGAASAPDASALTANRTLTMPDADVDLGALVQPDYLLSETGELIIATDGELLRF